MGRGTRQMQLICSWDFGLTCLDAHTDLKESCLPKRPQKRSNRGWYGSRGCFLPLPAKAAHRPTQAVMQRPIREEICLQQKNRRRQHFPLTAPAILYGILPVYTFIPAFSASRTRRHLCRLPAGWLPRQSMAGCCRQIPES